MFVNAGLEARGSVTSPAGCVNDVGWVAANLGSVPRLEPRAGPLGALLVTQALVQAA